VASLDQQLWQQLDTHMVLLHLCNQLSKLQKYCLADISTDLEADMRNHLVKTIDLKNYFARSLSSRFFNFLTDWNF
jgi:hypothetical protein